MSKLEYVQTFPGLLGQGGRISVGAASFEQFIAEPIRSIAVRIASDAQESIDWNMNGGTGYTVQDQYGPGMYSALIMNDWAREKGLPFWAVESGSQKHLPPHGDTSRLADWADRHNVSAYYVANLIAEKGTAAKHIFEAAWKANLPGAANAMARGASQFVNFALHGGK